MRRDTPSIRARETDAHALPDDWPAALKRVLAARGIGTPEDLQVSLDGLLRPDHLTGIDAAASLLADAVIKARQVCVVGDFDADGATATALCIRALRAFGLGKVDYVVPNRFDFGYGLSVGLVQVIQPRSPDLIITVDNGISSVAGVAAARDAGMDVIVTDHHLPGPQLPRANAIVNPNLVACEFPSKCLAGVGVLFYLLVATRQELQQCGHFSRQLPAPQLAQWLDLVALGTVADLVSLDANNRILVAQGLARIRAGHAAAGVTALLRVAGREPRHCHTSDLGFAVAPRLNAAGRLEDMSIGIECLLTDDPGSAQEFASRLDALNRERRNLQQNMQAQAESAFAAHLDAVGSVDGIAAVSLFDDAFHPGIVGLIASRLKERFHRPAVVFAPEREQSPVLKGSARSIPGLHIRDLLAEIDSGNPGLIEKFGGHAMAAGLSLVRDQYERFAKAFNECATEHLCREDLQRVIWTDGPLTAQECGIELAIALESALPWGQQCPEPLFDNRFAVLDHRQLTGGHLKLTLSLDGRTIDAIAFRQRVEQLPEPLREIRALYRLCMNRFRGRETAQLIIEHIV